MAGQCPGSLIVPHARAPWPGTIVGPRPWAAGSEAGCTVEKKKKDKEEVLEVQRESPGEEILGQAVGNGLHARCPRENLTGSLGALWRIQLSAAP